MDEKRDMRAERTQRHLREAFCGLIVKKPIEKITIRELTELAEVSRCTFYLHYDSIYELVKSIEEEMLSEYREGVRHIIEGSRDYSSLVEELISFSFRHKLENKDYAKALYKNYGGLELIGQYNKIVAQELTAAFPTKWNDMLNKALNFYVAGIINFIHQWILEDEINETPEEMSALVIEIIKNGRTYLSIFG